MNRTGEPAGRTSAEHRAGKRYLWEVGIGIVAYLVLFLILPKIVRTDPGTVPSIIVTLVPLVPVLWMVVALARHVRRVDELQRLLFLRSFAVGFGTSMVIALATGLLNGAGVRTEHAEWFVFTGGMASWGIALAILTFRSDR